MDVSELSSGQAIYIHGLKNEWIILILYFL